MREMPKSGDPDFVKKMVRFSEEDNCKRVLIPHLSDESLIAQYRQCQKEDSLGDDTFYMNLLHLEISVRIFERLIAEDNTKSDLA